MALPEPIPEFDLYAELEVAPSASPATIDAAWRSLVKRHHPDAAVDEAEDRIRRLNVAHDWLADPDRRARYDAERALRATNTWSPPPAPPPPPAAWRREAPPVSEDEVVWAELRRQAHAHRPTGAARTRARSLMASPIFAVAFGLFMIMVTIGGIVVITRLPAVARPASSPPPVAVATPAPTTAPLPSTDPAVSLAETLPDRVEGIQLVGETAIGEAIFDAEDSSLDGLLAKTGGSADDLVGAYKAGESPDGTFLTLIALRLESVSGAALAEAFRSTTAEDPAEEVDWTDASHAGRSVAVSRDAADPNIAAYLLSARDAMYLVITSDPALAEAAIRALP